MDSQSIRIGLWGGVGVGKTTFLSVLGPAAVAARPAWSISGIGTNAAEANEFLRRSEEQYAAEGLFNFSTTQISADMEWRFVAAGRVRRGTPAEFTLCVRDVPGGVFANLTAGHSRALVDYFAGCQGILYLFNPVDEVYPQQALLDTTGFLRELQTNTQSATPGARLRQHVAVCVTKFDEPAFFDEARRAGWGTQQVDPPRQPHVRNDQAAAFFDWLCRRSGGGGSTAQAIRQNLEAYFPDRVTYFVTSSIGFRLAGRDGTFDPTTDMFNYRPMGESPDRRPDEQAVPAKLVHPPNPINVLEPVLYLAKTVKARRGEW